MFSPSIAPTRRSQPSYNEQINNIFFKARLTSLGKVDAKRSSPPLAEVP